MATDVDVQYFSHLNGLVLSNNWGDMIRLLDTCLVNGLPLTSVTSATIDAHGDINLTLYAAHNCLLFQTIELTGFSPSELNGKYRIKGTPSATQLILKAEHGGKSIAAVGSAKLAPLGYEIKYRDSGDIKRAYRAINPRPEHPYIRVDESLSSVGGGTYTSTYAKFAMVGLIENMTHIDDYTDASKLQLPLDTADFTKNWKIAGTGASVVRGWSRWYWVGVAPQNSQNDSNAPTAGNRQFTLAGNKDAFYLLCDKASGTGYKNLNGCGLFNSALDSGIVPNWFLMTSLNANAANSSVALSSVIGGIPLTYNLDSAKFFTTRYNPSNKMQSHSIASPVLPNYGTGYQATYAASNVPALEVPFSDDVGYLRGQLPTICFAGKKITGNLVSTPVLSDNSMFVYDTTTSINYGAQIGGFLFYLGEME